MVTSVLTKFFGSRNQRLVKQMGKTVTKINALEPEYEKLSDDQIKQKTQEFKERVSKKESLDSILPEAFALVREASKRSIGLRHFDVQLVGGMVLHSGRISEMRTGEGKTLVATLPAFLNALSGHSVHIITVNDYLAQRDGQWMSKVFTFLGLTVGTIMSQQPREDKIAAYSCDIVYGTNNEFGFDYLRDNMAFEQAQKAQGTLNFAIIDEVDSILIDEARTPLIISGRAEDSTDLYQKINGLIPQLIKQAEESSEGDFHVDEKTRQINLSEAGYDHAEQLLTDAEILTTDSSLYDLKNISLLHHLYSGLRAHHLFHKDVNYIVRDDQIIIIDEFTGRMMPGRRWGEGQHQAVEAKEGLSIQPENHTLAAITFQNYFRLYNKLSGMTGTADTEAPEFQQIYGLEVVVIPTNKEMARKDEGDRVYRTAKEKYDAIIKAIIEAKEKNQPVLVGTTSIESSEYLAEVLTKGKIKHQVLNAKQHEREANIIAEAGRPGAVTIATNMAGRGTDIVLGGNLELELIEAPEGSDEDAIKADWKQRHQAVLDAGGLFVIGTERNESRRVDNQLRGRSGRQGDPGESRFFLSLDDSLMRIFGSERIAAIMQKLGMEEGEPIEHSMVSKSIENAQKKVEGRNFDTRKQLLEYDDVANEQRKVVYRERNELMQVDDVSDNLNEMREDVIFNYVSKYVPVQSFTEQWDIEGLQSGLKKDFALDLPLAQWFEEDEALQEEEIRQRVYDHVLEAYQTKRTKYGNEIMQRLEKGVMLQMLDSQWKDHLANMDYLRQGINLRSYAQKNPKQEYKREAFELFTAMLESVKVEIVKTLSRLQIREEEPKPQAPIIQEELKFEHPSVDNNANENLALSNNGADNDEARGQTFVRDGAKVGRNDPCPCGSGKKYKQCHGSLA